MCEFVSWKEMPPTWKPDVERRIYFLTDSDLKSKRGRELKKYLGPKYEEDKIGHGAIDWFYKLEGVGRNQECTEFLDPNSFPAEIAQAIKDGKFSMFGTCPQILTDAANEIYWASRKALEEPYWASLKALEEPYRASLKALEEPYRASLKALEEPYWASLKALFWKIAKDPQNRKEVWR